MIRLHDVLEGTGGELSGALSRQFLFERVRHDSRQIGQGDLFVAVRGERLDGHDFLNDARQNGAAAALVSREWFERQSALDIPVVVVEDTIKALADLATYWRGLYEMRVVGITGSIGKSSTKEVVAAVARTRFEVVKSVGSYNNEIGLPLTVLEAGPDTEVLVLEMGGAYRAGEISELVEIGRPDIGVVTNVTHSHLARMGSLEAIAETKSELVEGLPAEGVAFLNADDERVRGMASRTPARVVLYGLAEDAHVRATEVTSHGLDGISFTLTRGDRRDHVQVPLLGRHSVHTALVGIAVGIELGLHLADILRGFEGPDVQLRLVLTPAINGATILDDHYNANPKSSLAALSLLEDLDAERRLAVLGDMLEMGDFEEEAHRIVGRRVIDVVDALYTVGPRARYIADEALSLKPNLEAHHFDDKEKLTEALRRDMRSGDLVLVKGSRGVQMETIVDALRIPDAGDEE